MRKHSKEINVSGTFKIAVGFALCIMSANTLGQETKSDITGFKKFQFGMSQSQVNSNLSEHGKEIPLDDAILTIKLGSTDGSKFMNEKNPQEFLNLLKKFKSTDELVDTIISVTENDLILSDLLSAPGKTIMVTGQTTEFIYRNDSLKQIRRNLKNEKIDENVLEILTEKYGNPNVKLLKTSFDPFFGRNTSAYSFTFEAKSGRVRLIGMTSANFILDKINNAPKVKRKNGDEATAIIDSMENDFYAKQFKEIKEKAKEVKPFLLTYTDINFAKQAEMHTASIKANWKINAKKSIDNWVSAQKKKSSDEY